MAHVMELLVVVLAWEASPSDSETEPSVLLGSPGSGPEQAPGGWPAAFRLTMLQEIFVTEPAKPQPWQRSELGLSALRKEERRVPLPPCNHCHDVWRTSPPGTWCGNLSTEARIVAGQASPIRLQHLFPFLVAWASAACERDQASEACSLKLTA